MTNLEALDNARECIGHIPDPILDYLEWVMAAPITAGCAARVELRRVCEEITGS